jgi:hypothetical protein
MADHRSSAGDYAPYQEVPTSLRPFRAREAMIVAVQIFNSPILKFKTEIFAVLAHIAWTYLMHEYYHRRRVKIVGDDGRSLLLSQMLRRQDCPLSPGIKRNLEAMGTIRNDVEHKLLGQGDVTFGDFHLFSSLKSPNFSTDLSGMLLEF